MGFRNNKKRSITIRLLAGMIVVMMVLMLPAAMANAVEPEEITPETAVSEAAAPEAALTEGEGGFSAEAAETPAEEAEYPAEEADNPTDDVSFGNEDLPEEELLLPEEEPAAEGELLPEDEMTTQGGDITAQGYCGAGADYYMVTWKVMEGKLIISGTGRMADYYDPDQPSVSTAPWYPYSSQIYTIEVGYGVTSIGKDAFHGLSSVIWATLPDSVTEVGDMAFRNCTSLRALEFPSGLEKIGEAMFYYCTSLEYFHCPKGVKKIGSKAFTACTNMVEILLPDTLQEIGNDAFFSCGKLTKVTIPSGVTKIPMFCFCQCIRLESVTIPDSVTSIGIDAFYKCYELKSVEARGVYEIDDLAFCDCSKLEKAQFAEKAPSGKTGRIGKQAFANCIKLMQFNVPDGVAAVEEKTFSGCSGLRQVYFPASLTSVANNAFYDCSSLADFFYKGTEQDWSRKVTVVNTGNTWLIAATGHFIGDAAGVSVSKSSITVVGKGTYQLKATVKPLSAYQGVRWKSSNPGCAEVDENGLVRGVYRGTCTVTATTMDGKKTASCTVKVEFGDVPPGHTRYTAVSWGADRRITNGYKATNTFGVNDPCTRGHFVMFLWKYAGKPEPKQQSAAYFTDVPVGNTYFKAVQWAYEKGITKGVSATQFGLNQVCTRAQAMTFLWRYKGQPAPKGSVYPFKDNPKPNATQQKAIMWGSEQKITGGTDNGDGTRSFRPSDTNNRGHIMHFLYTMNTLK